QIKPYSSTHSLTGRKIVPHVSNASPGPYQFTDNIFSLANSKYVAAELGYTGGNYAMLRARTASNAIGPWEVFNWYAGVNGAYEIQSNANGLFVTAELGYTGGNYAMLRARTGSNAIGPWEQFFLYTLNGCNPVTTNCQSLILSAANNKLVSAELGYTGGNYAMLRARTDPNKAGPWEQFLV
ncbi:MAG: hypothetical protein JO031_10415, partial [Ktedonobacteraceae bacterium]|nr:hypothetical protein [Ktedonobacteraceae bacterium]